MRPHLGWRRAPVGVGILLLAAAAPAIGAPAVVTGWPVPSPAGTVHAAPDGQPLVISGSNAYLFTAQGTSVWSALRTPNCGNCDESPYTARLQPDGSFGPLGAGGDLWAVDPNGHFATPCVGVMLTDATCVTADLPPAATVRATGTGGARWSYTEPNLALESDGAPKVVAGAEGEVYVLLDPARATPSGSDVRYRVLSIDAATGARKWETDLLKAGLEQITFNVSGGQVLGARPGGGALVQAVGQLVALDRAGTIVWKQRYAGPPNIETDPSGLVVVLNGGSVQAIDAAAGIERWVVDGLDEQRLLSRGPSGTFYVAGERRGVPELAAYSPQGQLNWSYPTATPVSGARELGDGSVVVSTGTPGALDGLLTRIDPTRSAATPRKIRIGLTLRSFQTGVARFRAAARRSGTTAVLRLPRAARVRIQLTLPNGRRYPKVRSVLFDGSAPAGTSYVRVLAGSSARSGKGVLHVQVGGKRPIEVAFKVRLTGEPTRT